eukprot:9756074-Alexandrium_andersonii.AAC.1
MAKQARIVGEAQKHNREWTLPSEEERRAFQAHCRDASPAPQWPDDHGGAGSHSGKTQAVE